MSQPASNPPERPTPDSAHLSRRRARRVGGRPRHRQQWPLPSARCGAASAPVLRPVVAFVCGAAVAVTVTVLVALIVCGGW